MNIAQYTIRISQIMQKYANIVTAAQTDALKKIDVVCRQSGSREVMVSQIESIQSNLSKYVIDQIALREKEIAAIMSTVKDES